MDFEQAFYPGAFPPASALQLLPPMDQPDILSVLNAVKAYLFGIGIGFGARFVVGGAKGGHAQHASNTITSGSTSPRPVISLPFS